MGDVNVDDLKKGMVLARHPVNCRGRLLLRKGTYRQIRARREENEEKYRAWFEQADNSIIVYDMETRKPVEFNDSAHKNLGYTPEEFKALRIEDYEVDKTAEEIQHRIRQYYSRGSYSFETRHKRKDGTLRDVLVNSKCIQIRGKDYILAFLTDITERKDSEAERNALEKLLRQAQKMESIGTLAGGIAHDFNNILGIILGYAELALLDIKDKNHTLHNHIQQLIKAVDRAKKLVKQILTFSPRGDKAIQPIEVNSIIKEDLVMLRSMLPTTINIRSHIPNEPFVILGNPTEVHQVMMNLCTNSAQAMQGNTGVLKVELKKIDSEEQTGFMELTVGDTGVGIEPEVLERVFDPYFTTKRPGEGTGLGLAVVHGIVKRCGGDITIASTPGQGTTVKVKIPLIEAEVKPEEVALEAIPTGRETILLVDDEEALLVTFQQILEQLGYSVIPIDSSQQALENFRKTPLKFDLVICDLTMPQMTGIQLASELLNLRPDTPIILCTGFSEFIDAKTATAVGIKEILMKPFNKRTLAAAIRKVLDEK